MIHRRLAMGLFDFARDIGNKIFGNDDDDAGDKLKSHVEQDNPGVSDLKVDVKGETAVITGNADSKSAMEKVILMVGNAMGISNVEAAELTAPEEDQVSETQYYEIKKGDSLWKIARKFYGNGNRYPDIFEANKEVIKDPDLIFPGQKIRIPQK